MCLSLSLRDFNFRCFCLLGGKNPVLLFLFHYCFALLALPDQAGRIAVIISPDTTPQQHNHRARFWRCLSSFFFFFFCYKIEENRKLRLADHFIFNFHASLSLLTQAKTSNLDDQNFQRDGFNLRQGTREDLNKNISRAFCPLIHQHFDPRNILTIALITTAKQ